jgi:acyl-CoA thioesterase I
LTDRPVIYLALGDSYTIGTGATHESRNFPSVLAGFVEEATGRTVRLVNPAVNGFTTIDLLAKEIGFIDDLKPDLVSVLIGVNDLVRGRTVAEYRESLAEIYDAVGTLHLPGARVAAISIPDWSVVPAARDYGDPRRLLEQTAAFNAAAREEASRRGFTWIDIMEVSRRGLRSPGWVSADDLHPGDPQYAAWAREIWDEVSKSWSSL